jgi:zinc transport system substrate-binding protein
VRWQLPCNEPFSAILARFATLLHFAAMQLFTRFLLCLLPLSAVVAHAASLPVAVSVLPQKYLAERIGGRWVTVSSLVSSGKDPHTFEPTPAQVAQLAKAQLYFATGMSFETGWLGKLQRSQNTRVVDMRQGIKLRQQEAMLELGHGHDEHKHGGSDPHVWTSPANLRVIATTIERELAGSLPPASHAELRQNKEALLRDIDRSDQKIRALLAQSAVKRFMVFHPSWGYFADAYGLQQLPIEYEGKEPGPRTLAQIIAIGKREQIKVVFVQPQFSARAAGNIASSLNARVEKLDDLAENVLLNLESAAAAIAASR